MLHVRQTRGYRNVQLGRGIRVLVTFGTGIRDRILMNLFQLPELMSFRPLKIDNTMAK